MKTTRAGHLFAGAFSLLAVLLLAGVLFIAGCGGGGQEPSGADLAVDKGNPPDKGGQNGTTLAASKTLDICAVDDQTWRYSGVVSVWNEGAVDTEGLEIDDCIQNKDGQGKFADTDICPLFDTPAPIPAGTTLLTATLFPYSIEGQPLSGDIRNRVLVTITNHSGSLGTPKGPEPKATWMGGEPQPCAESEGCTLSQGYWKNHLDQWPTGYEPGADFFLSGQSWAQVLETAPQGGSGYYQLAHQYIALVLSQAGGAPVPDGIQAVMDEAAAWLDAGEPGVCGAQGSCGLQKTWAASLDDYIRQAHCPEE